MKDEEMFEFEAADRMIDFKNAHPSVFENNQKMMDDFVMLESDVGVLVRAGANRVASRGRRSDGTAGKNAAKNALYTLIRNIVETARTIKKEEPDFDNTFRIRRGTLSGAELLDVGRGFAADLTDPVAAKFALYGRRSATSANLLGKVAAFEAARTQQNTGSAGSVAATAETRAAIKRIKSKIRTMAVVGCNILEEAGEDGLLAEWKSACKVEKRHSKKTAPPENPPNPDE